MGQGQGVKYFLYCKLCSQVITHGVSGAYCVRCMGQLVGIRTALDGGRPWELPRTWFTYSPPEDRWLRGGVLEDEDGWGYQ